MMLCNNKRQTLFCVGRPTLKQNKQVSSAAWSMFGVLTITYQSLTSIVPVSSSSVHSAVIVMALSTFPFDTGVVASCKQRK